MNIGENLITLRKKEKISQEELAEKLGVSRQAISKWESGDCYPETEKLIRICEIFSCSLDNLVKGKIEDNKQVLKEYDKIMKSFASKVSIGLLFLFIGATLLLLFLGIKDTNNLTNKEVTLSISILSLFILISLPLFITSGLNLDHFKKNNPIINEKYQDEEINKFEKKFIFVITLSITFLILGVIQMIIMYALKTYRSPLIPVGLFMIFASISVPAMSYIGIQKDKYDIDKYNKNNNINNNKLLEKLCAITMIITFIIYLILGFIFNLWKHNWLLIIIGGMLCGIFGIILDKE